MQIILRGPAAGYEAEHTARLFFPDAEKVENLPQDSDFVLAQSHLCTDTILLRLRGRLSWKIALRPQGADPEYTLCRLLYTLLGEATGSTPPWGMMTGVRPVRIIHDMRASGATEDEIRARFLDHFACTPEKFALALGIADLQKPVLDAADPMDCSVYAGIPFCPTRCSYCSFVSRTVGDKATRALVQPYVDKLCAELTAIRETADRCGLHIRTFYIGGGTPTSLSAAQLEQLMSHIAKTFDLAKLDEYTVEGFEASLRQAIALDPENITVHTLTLKRASNIVVEHRAADYADVAAMLGKCSLLADAGYRPYYMYRQKGTLQNLENIGWAKPGFECLYNIYIMEEVHTILSAGAGGSTKLVIPGQRRGKIERIFNFKYPTEYIDRFAELLDRKKAVEDFYARYTSQTLRQP